MQQAKEMENISREMTTYKWKVKDLCIFRQFKLFLMLVASDFPFDYLY